MATKKPTFKNRNPKALMSNEDRMALALKHGVAIARKVGAKRVSMAAVASKMDVTPPLMFYLFGDKESFHKALVKHAKKTGVSLPEAAPTVREQRGAKPKVKKLLALPKKATPRAPKKLAALLSPKVNKTGKLPKPKGVKVEWGGAALAVPKRKPLTDAQREAKSKADKARRAAAKSPEQHKAERFAAIKPPFEAALSQVAAAS